MGILHVIADIPRLENVVLDKDGLPCMCTWHAVVAGRGMPLSLERHCQADGLRLGQAPWPMPGLAGQPHLSCAHQELKSSRAQAPGCVL